MTSKYYRYQILCSTENAYKYIWSPTDSIPCPNNAAHTVQTLNYSTCLLSKIITLPVYYLTNYFHRFNTTTSVINAYLPSAATTKTSIIVLTRLSGSNNLIINAIGSDLVDSSSTKTISDSNVYEFKSDGTNWISTNVTNITHNISNVQDERNELTASIPDIYVAINQLMNNQKVVPYQHDGDLLVGDGCNCSILSVGSNNKTLIADNTTDLGLRWGSLFDRQFVSSTTVNTRTSTTYADLPLMTLTTTLPSGTYNIFFSATGRITSITGSNAGNVMLNINNSNITNSLSTCRSTANTSINLIWSQVAITQGTVIKVRWASSSSAFTFTIDECRLIIDGILA